MAWREGKRLLMKHGTEEAHVTLPACHQSFPHKHPHLGSKYPRYYSWSGKRMHAFIECFEHNEMLIPSWLLLHDTWRSSVSSLICLRLYLCLSITALNCSSNCSFSSMSSPKSTDSINKKHLWQGVTKYRRQISLESLTLLKLTRYVSLRLFISLRVLSRARISFSALRILASSSSPVRWSSSFSCAA